MPIYFPSGAQGDLPGSQTQGQVNRARRETDYVHRSVPKNPDTRGRGQYYYPPMVGLATPAVVNSPINACNGTTPGNGTVDVYALSFNTNSNSYESALVSSNQDCVSWYHNNAAANANTNTTAINSGVHVTVITCGAFYLLLGADC